MRLTVSAAGVPQHLRAALLPVPAGASAKATTYGDVGRSIVGHPGNLAIPAPKPGALPETAAGWRGNQPSYASPDVRYPSIYYLARSNRPPVPIRNHNPRPVPARNLWNMPRIAQKSRRIGGQSQIGMPAALQTWPQWKPGSR